MAHKRKDDLPYRGLYAGIGEVAALGAVSRQYAARDIVNFDWFPEPLGYLKPAQRKWPYWFYRDVYQAMASNGKLRGELEVASGAPIEDWEYDYRGQLWGPSQIAAAGGFTTGYVHKLTRDPDFAPWADAMCMSVAWRREDVMASLLEFGYLRGREGGVS